MSRPAESPSERLCAALAAAAVHPSVRHAWTARPPHPAAGQIWRARWASVTQIVVVLEAPARSVRAAPATLDVEMADDSAVIVPADGSELTVPLVVWLGDAMALPMRVLDRFMGLVRVDLRNAGGLQRGRPVLSAADDRAVYRARLQDGLDLFAGARWAPEGDGSLGDVIDAAGARRVAEALDVPDRMVIALRRGRAPLSPDQAQRLAPLVGCGPEELLAANPPLPDDLVADLDLPEYRTQVNALAHRRAIDEIEAWLTVGYGVAAVAHRQTEGDAPSWRDRLDRYFQAVLGDH